ncbi:aldehyde ferredoxin oxidoreductase C-terminal domain-containing protein, partial [Chloroflexota bacterium]
LWCALLDIYRILFIDNGKAELRDASQLWGKDCYETEDTLKAELGKDVESICIGPSGEKLARIACIITDRGAAAGRSGMGAVMGSKKLKAIAARGDKEVPVVDKAKADNLRKEYLEGMKKPGPSGVPFTDHFGKYGTSGGAGRSAHSGDGPVKNWGGIGIIDVPDIAGLSGDLAIENVDKRGGCWHCPIACESRLKAGTGEYKYPAGIRRIEYETQGSFGVMCANTDKESLNMANHICNSYGLDTISAGTVIAFAMELYENGIITKEDTDGIELTWGNHRAMIDMTWKMAKREGLGDILADGVKIAAEKIGKGAEEYAVHIGGQELGMHDPKLPQWPGQQASSRYQMDATPGRHTQDFGHASFGNHLTNSVGLCLFNGMAAGPDAPRYTEGFMSAITGLDRSMDELRKSAERIANIRHAFNLREGINQRNWEVHPRIIGTPPQAEGPLSGVTCDIEAEIDKNLKELDWDLKTTKPSKKKLLELGLDDIARDLWP